MPPAMPLLWNCHLYQTVIPVRYISFPKLLLPVHSLINACIIPNPSILSASESQHVSHKTLKVYLCGIRLWHIKEGFKDPTSDPLLQLVCKGICHMQGNRCCTRLPITINLLDTLKRELQQSRYSLTEQQMLRCALTIAFYGFLCASEYLNLQ